MDGYTRTEDELFSSCLLNLTWENCYEQGKSLSVGSTQDEFQSLNKYVMQVVIRRMSQSVVSPFSLAMGPVDTGIRHSSHWGERDMLAAITIHEAVSSTLSPNCKRCLSAPLLPSLSLSARGG
ncbi:hypothetical protein PAMA_013948 [Pampus argenteus]